MSNINPKMRDYIIPSTITCYDSKVERDLGFIYGLEITTGYTLLDLQYYNIASGDIVKIPAGRMLRTNLDYFFHFKNYNNEDIDPFFHNYPEARSYGERYIFKYITKKVDDTYFKYDYKNSTWTTDLNQCTYFFNDVTCSSIINKCNLTEDGTVSCGISGCAMIIKNLVNDGLKFPVSSFEINNIDDYLQ